MMKEYTLICKLIQNHTLDIKDKKFGLKSIRKIALKETIGT
jgi:hypothetical protein